MDRELFNSIVEAIFEIIFFIFQILEISYALSTIVFAIGLGLYFERKSK